MSRSKAGRTVTDSISKVFRLVGGKVSAGPRKPTQGETPAAVEATDVAPPTPTEEQIRELAYRKWEAAGHPSGDGVEFWLAAERELTGG